VDISDGQGEKAPLGALTELKGLICSDLAPDEITQKLADPSQLLELSLDSPGTLDGIASFENLERLTVEDISSPDLKQLVALKNLKFLSLEESFRVLEEFFRVLEESFGIREEKLLIFGEHIVKIFKHF